MNEMEALGNIFFTAMAYEDKPHKFFSAVMDAVNEFGKPDEIQGVMEVMGRFYKDTPHLPSTSLTREDEK